MAWWACVLLGGCAAPGAEAPAIPALPNAGSGVFVSPAGDLLTAAHLVAACGRIAITSDRLPLRDAVLVRLDEAHDTALLQSAGPVPGVVAVAQGAPHAPFAAFGYSGDSRSLVSEMSWPHPLNAYLRADAPDEARRLLWFADGAITHGWSGGPVIDADGRLVGVIKSVVTDPAEMNGIMQIPQGQIPDAVAAAEPVAQLAGGMIPPDAPERSGVAQQAVVRVFCWPG